ncbi:hypothetical protein BCV69DRAFT_295466 [Microstroma glucosiphilum]|uniref:Uncharacterized protein n=1 Tax=Pseudomicrostroma glucosiphilum TaxID=1684307 RepID=A0A316TYJ8_9BASI|nr:hypothetical protein BCV69DRAFT_295466 [Pseudomicrostroma glucosiphilum]PWN18359.1 hypothetical protein BCV69DRAFT_295466 [Pseudomicrostroma glucosiphilum]
MSSPAAGPVQSGAADEGEHLTSTAPPSEGEVAAQDDVLKAAADVHIEHASAMASAGQASDASSSAQGSQLTADAQAKTQVSASASSSPKYPAVVGSEGNSEYSARTDEAKIVEPSPIPGDSDLAIVGEYSADEVKDSTLEALRTKIIQTRGARAQLPAGWEEDTVMPAIPDASDSNRAQGTSSSSSESDSDSSSSDDSSDDDQEQVTMVSDYDSDDSSVAKKGTGDGPRGPMTKSELPPSRAAEMFGKLPFEEVPQDRKCDLKPLGKVHGNVQEVLVIAQAEEVQRGNVSTAMSRPPPGVRVIGGASNERQGPILDAGSLVCTQEGKVIGFIFETFGSLLAPLYSVLLPTSTVAASYKSGQDIFFLPSHSTILRPAELRATQGKASDASNVNDEEAGVEEMDFSDDEEEAEFKRRLKASKKRSNARGPGGSIEEGHTDGTSRSGRGISRGVDRGRGRGRGGTRGRGDRGTDLDSTQRGGSTAAFPLPQRPNWQLDDPAPTSATTLSYDEPASSASVGGRSKPSAYESGRFTPPKSAGLPAIPKIAAELADPISSEARTASATRTVHPLPPIPSPAPPAPATDTPMRSGVHNASATPPTLPASRPHQTGASAVAGSSSIAGSPAFTAGPPPGAHINPLFAHQWAPQQSQQQQHVAPSPHYTGVQQQHYSSQQQYPQQAWNGYQYNYRGQVGGGQYPYPQQHAQYGGQQVQQTPYWSQQHQDTQQYSYPPPYGQHQQSYANGSVQGHAQGQGPHYWPTQQYQGGQYPPDGAGDAGNGSYDPSEGKMNFGK